MLNQLLADVYIFTDHVAGPEAGLSPGYGIMLVAETTAKNFLSAEAAVAADAMVRRKKKEVAHILTC
jgi:RNA 3'-terminal phosphate cyclase-like protein